MRTLWKQGDWPPKREPLCLPLPAQLFWAILLVILASFAAQAKPSPLPSAEYPYFADDLDMAGLAKSLEHSLAYLQKMPADTSYRFGKTTISSQRLILSLAFFQQLLRQKPTIHELNRKIREAYVVYRIKDLLPKPGQRMLITAYYHPVFEASMEPNPPFLYPLYEPPADLVTQKDAQGKKKIGRMEKGRLLPFWTRREIDTHGKLRGKELVWLQDPFDAFIVHIQGSAMVRLADGTLRGLSFAQRNGHPYTSIGKYLVDTGRMRLEDVNMDSMRSYLADRPEERDTILHQNASYIFFRWSPAALVTGSLGRELTPGRSLAADRSWYPPGALLFVDTRRPVMKDGELRHWQPLRRFMTVQDVGAAIIGPGRLDIFWGLGEQAGREAGRMKEDGEAYLLLLKPSKKH